MIDLTNVESMNSESFTRANYIADWWYLLDINLIDLNMLKLEESIKDIIVGYCDGTRLLFKPKEGVFAIMVLKEGEQFWCHIPKKDCII